MLHKIYGVIYYDLILNLFTNLLIQTKSFILLMQDFFYNGIEIQFEVCLHVIVVTADSCFFFALFAKIQ